MAEVKHETKQATPSPPPSGGKGLVAASATPTPATATERPNYQCIQTLKGHTRSVASVKFSLDGILASACNYFLFSVPLYQYHSYTLIVC
jgi:WD40 repeat protein